MRSPLVIKHLNASVTWVLCPLKRQAMPTPSLSLLTEARSPAPLPLSLSLSPCCSSEEATFCLSPFPFLSLLSLSISLSFSYTSPTLIPSQCPLNKLSIHKTSLLGISACPLLACGPSYQQGHLHHKFLQL